MPNNSCLNSPPRGGDRICPCGNKDNCPYKTEKRIPIKVYTAKGAVRALLSKKGLWDVYGRVYYYDSGISGFRFDKYNPETGKIETFPAIDFIGLFEKL